jgi:hypothetical protein
MVPISQAFGSMLLIFGTRVSLSYSIFLYQPEIEDGSRDLRTRNMDCEGLLDLKGRKLEDLFVIHFRTKLMFRIEERKLLNLIPALCAALCRNFAALYLTQPTFRFCAHLIG